MSAPARHYGCVDEGVLLQRELDGLTLVFHRPSGLTHMLASPLPEILDALEEEPEPADIVLERLSARYDLGEDALAELTAHLEELAALGLIESRLCATA
ncbi:MAG: HPr-rel-A system PqqD family peptide chaperone [Sphingomonadaceae bacterium]|jgi:PqqD family protein of HPr-rel-A system